MGIRHAHFYPRRRYPKILTPHNLLKSVVPVSGLTSWSHWIAREQRQPPPIDIEDSTLQSLCRDMSHLQVDASTEARVETRNSDTQIGDFLPLELLSSAIQVVESALSPTSDAR